ncbi:hypothetical protein [Nonomuraea longicatena]|uniref:Uncharacterized protein n=1 Tax=Nonomuraea longicatena TaxID=83682 RepID=A0ABP4BCT6_9ACTN
MTTKKELRQVEEDLVRLKESTRDLRTQINEMGATDLVERSQMLSMADEQDELVADLERRRDELRRRLGEPA